MQKRMWLDKEKYQDVLKTAKKRMLQILNLCPCIAGSSNYIDLLWVRQAAF